MPGQPWRPRKLLSGLSWELLTCGNPERAGPSVSPSILERPFEPQIQPTSPKRSFMKRLDIASLSRERYSGTGLDSES